MRRNIAFIHAGFPGGGAERITKDIAEYLNRFEGMYRISVLTRYVHDHLLTPDYTRNITIVHIGDTSEKTLTEVIREYNIDIIVQSSFPIKDIAKIKKATGVKVVFASHEEPFWRRYLTSQRGFLKKLIFKILPSGCKHRYAYRQAISWTRNAYRNCDAFTVLCNDYVAQIRNGLQLGENHHIHPIENPEYIVENINYKKENVILYSGRLDQMSKQLDKLLRIWKNTQDSLPDWTLIISGDGKDRDFLIKESERLNLSRCQFIGHQTNMQQWYDKASIVCLTSRTEGWPLCMTEAQANGCICIAFGCTAGVIDILSPSADGTCGFVIKPYDEKEYADTLIAIAHMSEEEKDTIRRNAIKKRSEYVPEKIAEKWRLLFESLY